MPGRRQSPGMPVEYDFYCCSLRSLCRRLEATPLVSPLLHADNLKCSSVSPRALFGAARFTVRYVRAVCWSGCVCVSG